MTPQVAAPDEVILRIEGLKKSYGGQPVLRGVELTVTRADVFVIIGPNGCGKSTFLRCLNLLETYQEGRVWLRGELASEGRPEEHIPSHAEDRRARLVRQKIGMVFQQFNLFPHLSVIQNVMVGPYRVLKKPYTEAREIAERVLRKVGLLDRADRDPLTLSGGQQQRVAIARALAMDPDVVLFDEATSALDPVLTNEVLRVIRDLAYSDGMTMLLITHDMDFARDIADQVLFMEQGRITVQGEPKVIFDERPTQSLRDFLQ